MEWLWDARWSLARVGTCGRLGDFSWVQVMRVLGEVCVLIFACAPMWYLRRIVEPCAWDCDVGIAHYPGPQHHGIVLLAVP